MGLLHRIQEFDRYFPLPTCIWEVFFADRARVQAYVGDKMDKFGLGTASVQRMSDLNVFDEFHLRDYKSSALYKEKMKKCYDQGIEKREFVVSDLVLLLNSRLHLILVKLNSK